MRAPRTEGVREATPETEAFLVGSCNLARSKTKVGSFVNIRSDLDASTSILNNQLTRTYSHISQMQLPMDLGQWGTPTPAGRPAQN